MHSYLTEYIREKQYETPWPDMVWVTKIAGPRIEARTRQEAEEKLSVLVAFSMVHPKTCIIDRLEEEWDG